MASPQKCKVDGCTKWRWKYAYCRDHAYLLTPGATPGGPGTPTQPGAPSSGSPGNTPPSTPPRSERPSPVDVHTPSSSSSSSSAHHATPPRLPSRDKQGHAAAALNNKLVLATSPTNNPPSPGSPGSPGTPGTPGIGVTFTANTPPSHSPGSSPGSVPSSLSSSFSSISLDDNNNSALLTSVLSAPVVSSGRARADTTTNPRMGGEKKVVLHLKESQANAAIEARSRGRTHTREDGHLGAAGGGAGGVGGGGGGGGNDGRPVSSAGHRGRDHERGDHTSRAKSMDRRGTPRDTKSPKRRHTKQTALKQVELSQQDKTIGSYTIAEPIGKGGCGVVYKGINTTNGQIVAIKRVNLHGLQDDEIESLEMEFKLLKNLDHPNIVRYIEAIRKRGYLHIIMEFMDIGALSSYIKKQFPASLPTRPPEPLLARYMFGVIKGLQYLHERGVAHRDIKGANILIDKAEHVKLADFGVATQVMGENLGEEAVGTPYWMAPEVIQMQSRTGITTACDIWSLGCTVIELQSGSPPNFDLNPMTAMYRIVQNDITLPTNVSPDLRDFLSRCFKKDPKERADAKTLLTHPWLKSCVQLSEESPSNKDDSKLLSEKQHCAVSGCTEPRSPSSRGYCAKHRDELETERRRSFDVEAYSKQIAKIQAQLKADELLARKLQLAEQEEAKRLAEAQEKKDAELARQLHESHRLELVNEKKQREASLKADQEFAAQLMTKEAYAAVNLNDKKEGTNNNNNNNSNNNNLKVSKSFGEVESSAAAANPAATRRRSSSGASHSSTNSNSKGSHVSNNSTASNSSTSSQNAYVIQASMSLNTGMAAALMRKPATLNYVQEEQPPISSPSLSPSTSLTVPGGAQADHKQDGSDHDRARRLSTLIREDRRGTNFMKTGKRGKPHERNVKVLPDGTLTWSTGKLKLVDVTEILPGKTTKSFATNTKADPDRCFSIVTKERTLDLEAADKIQRDEWVLALRQIVEEEKDKVRQKRSKKK